MPTWIALSFQDSTSPFIEQIIFFHDHSIVVLIVITTITLYLVTSLILGIKFDKYTTEGQEIETIWTILPAFILIFIALPSIKTLYIIEDTKTPRLTIKAIGHQWYWSYEYTSLNKTEIERFIENSKNLRLLKTTEILNLPVNTLIRCMVTSNDVIHSWALPSLGTKVDAIPGRLNQVFLFSKRLGIFSGQCSEICGINHSFIPISIKFNSPIELVKKIKSI